MKGHVKRMHVSFSVASAALWRMLLKQLKRSTTVVLFSCEAALVQENLTLDWIRNGQQMRHHWEVCAYGLSVRPVPYLQNHTADLHQIFTHVARGDGSVLYKRRCNMLCTAGFVDDVMFSYHRANGPESSTMLCFDQIRQVAVQFGRQTTSVWPSLSECLGEVCYQRLTCVFTARRLYDRNGMQLQIDATFGRYSCENVLCFFNL